jgi:GrpB-like predicted nucleotidyltransferase (UPF0157 family)
MAEDHAERLRALGSILVTVEHIGSTSVPGLAAKAIIDLMPIVTSLTDLDLEQASVEALGYDWHGELGMTGRRYCTLSSGAGVRMAQLHFFEVGSPHIARHIAFRDYLRAHAAIAAEYEREKRRACELHPDDSHAYTLEKSKWVRDAEARALNWFAQRLDTPN